ncbi:MAG: amidohydrolase family protein, partial [Candidatus Heimdallarchaeota archaeon]|nr:amidohydrolase family protein [Candidatus Heimdallarchaeota archaeon]
LILGTDTPNPFIVPGFSIHEEIRYIHECGLTPYQTLLHGTVNASKHLGIPEEFGTISVGARADLILLNGNPLEDLENLKKLAGVIVRGMWIDQQQINSNLEQLNQKYNHKPEDFSGMQDLIEKSPDCQKMRFSVTMNSQPIGLCQLAVSEMGNGTSRFYHIQMMKNKGEQQDEIQITMENDKIDSFTWVHQTDSLRTTIESSSENHPNTVLVTQPTGSTVIQEFSSESWFQFSEFGAGILMSELLRNNTDLSEIEVHEITFSMGYVHNIVTYTVDSKQESNALNYIFKGQPPFGYKSMKLQCNSAGIPTYFEFQKQMGRYVFSHLEP